MDEHRAKALTVASVGAAGILASLEDVAAGRRPQLRIFVGVAVSGVVLLAICEAAPSLGGGLALLLLVGALLRNGTAVASTLSHTLEGK